MLKFTGVIILYYSVLIYAQLAYSQSFNVNWENLKNTTFSNNVVNRPLLALAKGTASSKECLWGNAHNTAADGSFEYTIEDLGQLKIIGFQNLNDPWSKADVVDLGFNFGANNQLTAFSRGKSVVQSYTVGAKIKLERILNTYKWYYNNSVILEDVADTRDALILRVEFNSVGSKFGNVKTSFNTTKPVLVPTYDFTARTLSLKLNGNENTIVKWDNGLVSNTVTNPLNSNYSVEVSYPNGVLTNRQFGFGDLIKWTNFNATNSSNGNLVQTTSLLGLNWGYGEGTSTITPTQSGWLEYTIHPDLTGSQRAIGLSNSTVLVNSLTNLIAGFSISGDLLQLVFNGNVVATRNFTEYDQIKLMLTLDGVAWLQNGIIIRTERLNQRTSNWKVIGLIKNMGTIKQLNAYFDSKPRVTSSYDETTQRGAIKIDLGQIQGNAPYRYMICDSVIGKLIEKEYAFPDSLKESLTTIFNSESFKTDLPLERFVIEKKSEDVVVEFPELNENRFFIIVEDASRNRLIGQWHSIQRTVPMQNAVNLEVLGTTVKSNSILGGAGNLMQVFKPENPMTWSFKVIDVVGEQYYGLTKTGNTVQSINQLLVGFRMVDNIVQPIVNGQPTGVISLVKPGDVLSITNDITTSTVKLTNNAATLLNTATTILNDPFTPTLKLTGIFGIDQLIIFDFVRPYTVGVTTIQSSNCKDANGQFTFSVYSTFDNQIILGGGFQTVSPPINYTYSIRNNWTNQYLVQYQNKSAQTNQQINIQNLPSGVYTIEATVLGSVYKSSATIYSEQNWVYLNNYSSNSIGDQVTCIRNSTQNQAVSLNRLPIEQKYGEYKFKFFGFSPAFINLMYLTLNKIENPLSGTNIDLLIANVRMFNSEFLILNNGVGIIKSTKFNNRTDVVSFSVDATHNKIKVYQRGTFIGEFIRPNGIIVPRTATENSGFGIKNIETTFSCPTIDPNYKGYYVVKDEPEEGFTLTSEGFVRFTFDEEYVIPPGKFLAYSIYKQDRTKIVEVLENGTIVGSSNTQFKLNYVTGDNFFDLNLNGTSLFQKDQIYSVEITTTKGEKKYFNFLYQ